MVPLRYLVTAFALACGSHASRVAVTLPHVVPPSRVATTDRIVLPCPKGLVAIGGGSYVMGEPPSEEGWTMGRVTVRPFCLGRTEVTAAEYKRCVTSGDCTPNSLDCDAAATYDQPNGADRPINCVDWAQASAYCMAHGDRLPTEAEWEWAARNGDQGTTYPWGNDAPTTPQCFSGAIARTETCRVGSFPPSPLGLFDMAGNTSEWTSSRSSVDGSKVATRGGAYPYTLPYLRTAGRYYSDADVRDSTLGFRCAR